jgi:hypothetical protein
MFRKRSTIRRRRDGDGTQALRTPARELASRVSDGIHVLLLWHPVNDAVTVAVNDVRTGNQFELAVAGDRALDAFYHPFAYAL